MSLPVTAEAQPQAVFGTSSIVVLPIRDIDGSMTTTDSQKATDAMALALEASGEFAVTPKRALQHELDAMGLLLPLAVTEQIRLADQLNVEKVLNGRLSSLAVNQSNGQVRVRLIVEILDIATAEFLDGADIEVVTHPIPGWSGERNQVVNEALRQAADTAVARIIMDRTPIGFVTSVASTGKASVNVGSEDGIRPGAEMVVMRPVYQEDLEEVRLIKMGRCSVLSVSSDMSWIAPLKDGRLKVGDRTYALHVGVARAQTAKREARFKGAYKLVAGLGALFGLLLVGGGDHTAGPPQNVSARLFQQAPGEEAVIRIRVPSRSIPLTDQIFAWLLYRREGQQSFPLDAEALVAVWPEPKLPGEVWDDDAAYREDLDFDATYTYIGPQGDEETVSVNIVYNHPPLLPGGTYFYRVQRIVETPEQAGSGSPITAQVGSVKQPPPASIDVDPQEALSEGSKATNGVTYFTPVTLQAPDAGAQNQSTSAITFSWSTTLGANEYQLQVFPEDDPSGLRNPDFQVTERRDSAGTMTETITASFASAARYYWRVGARRTGEPTPQSGNQTGWLYSGMRTFTTAVAPPPPPAGAGAGSGVRAYGGASRLHRYGH